MEAAGKDAALVGNHQSNAMSAAAGGTVSLQVAGMTCKHCVAKVQGALEAVAGVESASVDLKSGLAVVRGTAAGVELVRAVEAAGKDAALVGNHQSNAMSAAAGGAVSLQVAGMTY